MLYTALCGEILELKSCLAEPGPDPRPAPHYKCFLLCPVWWNHGTKLLPSWARARSSTPASKQMLYTALCGEILELKSYLAEPGPGPRSTPTKNKCFTHPLWWKPGTILLPSSARAWPSLLATKQMLYTALCGEILGLNSCLAEPGPGSCLAMATISKRSETKLRY